LKLYPIYFAGATEFSFLLQKIQLIKLYG
jgi:hypothetical protein